MHYFAFGIGALSLDAISAALFCCGDLYAIHRELALNLIERRKRRKKEREGRTRRKDIYNREMKRWKRDLASLWNRFCV